MEEKSWLQRNLKWVIGGGCLIPICCVALFVGLISAVFGVIRSSDVYQEALLMVQTDQAAIDVLGEPIEDGWIPTGNVNTEGGGGGDASLAIPVSGPNGDGTLYVEATRSAGVWSYNLLELEVDGRSDRINLLPR